VHTPSCQPSASQPSYSSGLMSPEPSLGSRSTAKSEATVWSGSRSTSWK
jgi:hypothetical protein